MTNPGVSSDRFDSDRGQPKFSVIIPARNEERCLPLALDALEAALQAAQTSAEVIVVVNRSTDRTEEIARARGCKIINNDTKNLSIIRNAGARVAQGEYIVTVDADSRVSKNMFTQLLGSLSNPRTVGGGVSIVPERLSLGIVCSGLMLVPVVLWYRIAAGLFYCRREDFNAIGGFDETLLSVEDVDFAIRLKAHGKKSGRKFRFLPFAYIVTSCRKFDEFGDWFFFRNPKMTWRLFFGKDESSANKVWYDFDRR